MSLLICRTYRRMALWSCGFILTIWLSSSARVQFPVAQSYEDTVRVLVLYNFGASGLVSECRWYSNGTTPESRRIGTETWQFVTSALEGVTNIRSMYTTSARIDTIRNAFGPGIEPHVIVHINAGWGGTTGPNYAAVQDYCLNNNIGVVALGDDEMTSLAPAFPWSYQMSMWAPMGTATWLRNQGDRLYMVIDTTHDKVVDSTQYPHLSGVIRNAHKIAGSDTIDFKPVAADGRCEADADVLGFDSEHADKVKFLAYQQGYSAGGDEYVGTAWDYCVTTLIQDSLKLKSGEFVLRRAVSLSMQPQFVNNTAAMHQLVYDAIMYASLIHMENPPLPWDAVVKIRENSSRTIRPSSFVVGTPVRITNMAGRTMYEGPALPQASLKRMSATWRSGVYVITANRAGAVQTTSFTVTR